MGTERDVSPLRLYFLAINGVKLNNPLMGTERTGQISDISWMDSIVKLNNPLMGTERAAIILALSNIRKKVKLNNPLMGTEN